MADIKERFLVTIDNTEYDLNLSRSGESCIVELNGDRYSVSFDKLSGQNFLFRLNENSSEIDITKNNGTMSMFLDGLEMDVKVEPYSLAELRKKVGTSSEARVLKLLWRQCLVWFFRRKLKSATKSKKATR